MRVSAKVDYAVCALAVPTAAGDTVEGDEITAGQDIPFDFLGEQPRRPAAGPATVSIADVIRVIDGPLADVRGVAPEELNYPPDVQPLQRVWVASRANLRAVLEGVTIADVANNRLPAILDQLVDDPGAWVRRHVRSGGGTRT